MSCYSFLKGMMFLFNFLIFLGGAGLLAVGIWVTADGSSFLKFVGPYSTQVMQFVNVGYFCIAVGAVLVILGFLGCCGALRESKCLLLIFFSIVLIIFIAEVAAAVVALVYSSFAESVLKALVLPELKSKYGNDNEVTKIWNATMTELKCCGFNNYTDFNDSTFMQQYKSYPTFCCKKNQTGDCTLNKVSSAKIPGCFDSLLYQLKKDAKIVGGIAAGICALELASLVVSMYLYCQIDKGERA
ncbi:tetraspanin-1-like [Polypterus senegalus]|uniref:tetraspanin-1-like n=1 Tax=Polypterus senegalus TaxID=55291 RepID=UPI001962E083|nr:tetraspanin-1-like [Polypterus senegalus]